MYNDILIQTGLTENEALVYEYLLKNGKKTAGDIIKNTPLKRGVVYNVLSDLVDKKLVNQKTKKKIAYFSPDHPEKLRDYLEDQESKIQKAERTLNSNMKKLISEFNIATEKPGVKYYEGVEGLKKVLSDVLTSTEDIMTFADVKAIVTYIEAINTKHAEQRQMINLKKRIIVNDSPFAKNYLKGYHPGITEFRSISHELYPMYSVVEIYNGKVAFISLSDKGIISMLVTDQNIYNLHKSVFKFIWERADKFKSH